MMNIPPIVDALMRINQSPKSAAERTLLINQIGSVLKEAPLYQILMDDLIRLRENLGPHLLYTPSSPLISKIHRLFNEAHQLSQNAEQFSEDFWNFYTPLLTLIESREWTHETLNLFRTQVFAVYKRLSDEKRNELLRYAQNAPIDARSLFFKK